MSAKVQTMAYVGEVPWHGLGNALPADPTVAQMRKAAGLMWEPQVLEQRFTFDGKPRPSPDRVLVRSDTGFVLDTVGPKYVPIQNEQVLEFFREYVEAGDLSLETAGVLDGGRYVWALAKMKAGFALDRTDKTEGYVWLANPHVYGCGAVAKFTAVRVVCWNTWQAALAGGRAGTKIWHTSDFDADRRKEVQEEMGIARERLATYKVAAELLAGTPLTEPVAKKLAAKILKKEAATAEAKKWDDAPKVVKRVVALYLGEAKGADLVTAKATAWGLFNAVTQYVDWEHGKTADTRLRQAWLGSGATLKQRALDVLTEHASKK
jgi:phage/plasmid-like protein (TIGR03299 family)